LQHWLDGISPPRFPEFGAHFFARQIPRSG